MPPDPQLQADDATISDRESRRVKRQSFVKYLAPGKDDRGFFWQTAKGLRPFQYDLAPRSESAYQGPLNRAFFGVCAAEPHDAEACQRALQLIGDLGVGAVRIDCTYGQESSILDQFIEGLSTRGVDVLLHLVQPIEFAQRMPEASTIEDWRRFMESSLERFGSKVRAVEIGTTINRAKWSGYTISGFFALWEVSFAIAKDRGVTLVGPNITDFEPPYNAGVLGLMAERGLLPDVHSNNLFAERAVEPENYDRKILGPLFSSVHGYDLRKKMRLLAAIA